MRWHSFPIITIDWNQSSMGNCASAILNVANLFPFVLFLPLAGAFRSSAVRYRRRKIDFQKPWHSQIPENDFVSSIVTYFNQPNSPSLSYLGSCLAYISIDIKFFYHQRSGFWLHQNFTTSSFSLSSSSAVCFVIFEIPSRGRSIIKSIIIKKGTRERHQNQNTTKHDRRR